ncbi:MAG: hypothetical protein JXA10_03055, partial [Anaerolineae bacterium]|nr:hypothetical protein [Anaerolineae bacterium]
MFDSFIFNDDLALYTAIGFLLYTAFLVIVVRRFLSPFSFKTLVFLTVLNCVILLFSRAPWNGDPDWAGFWQWFRSVNGEYNPLASFSTAQLLGVGVGGLVIGLWASSLAWWGRVYWVIAGLIFGGMAVDEYHVLHEGHNWMPVYAALVASVVIGGAAVFWFGLKRQTWPAFVLMLGGLGFSALGSAVLEKEAARRCTDVPGLVNICQHFPFLEEMFELVGISLVVAGVLSLAQQIILPPTWTRARRGFLAGVAVSLSLLLSTFWLVPRLEAHFIANTVDVRYMDQHLALVGYTVPEKGFKPGDKVELAFFWEAKDWVPLNFNMSAQLLTYPNAEFVTSESVLVIDPLSSSWPPGFLSKKSATLTIPDDVITPASLSVSAPIWYASRKMQNLEGVTIDQSSVPLFSETLPDLAHIAVLPVDAPPDPPHETKVRFAAGFTLAGYALPEEVTGSLVVSFWWKGDANGDMALTQAFHLYDTA